jgi:acyl-CoA thioester hydrolase
MPPRTGGAVWLGKPNRAANTVKPPSGCGMVVAMPAAPGEKPLSHTIVLRVRYPEVDAMGYLHHSRYLQYFEIGRVELLRSLGHRYADLERRGVFFVVVKAEIRYRAPARYDEELTLTTRLSRATHVRYDHAYDLKRGEILLAEGSTTIACVDRAGQVQQIPDDLLRM